MNIVRELRLKAGMQQKEVALYVGVANPTVSEWEHQKKDPSGERLKKLAKLFGVTPESILGVDLNAIMAKFTTAYPMPQQNHLPIYGTIKCGPGGWLVECMVCIAICVRVKIGSKKESPVAGAIVRSYRGRSGCYRCQRQPARHLLRQ